MNDSQGYDVIVMGAGPAGSTVANLVAREGHRTLLLDREEFPRFRIGESLMPATYATFKRLGIWDKLHENGFTQKHSVQFVSKSGRSSVPFYFNEFDPHERSRTFQVERARFDQLLMECAAEAGADVRIPANVKDVVFRGEQAVGVQVDFGDGESRTIPAKVVVDATGQTAMISRRLGLKIEDPELRHAAVFTRYRGARREPGRAEGATLVLQTERPKCWFWYIPLADDIVSVGVVGPIDTLIRGRSGDPQKIYDEEVELCTSLQERIAGAEQVEPVGVLRDFSYVSKRIAGDGWVMAGDAFGFLDPIYSTGVFLALKSAEFAADAILEGLSKNDVSGKQLGRHGDEYLAGMEAMRKLVYTYYDENFHVPLFLKDNPEFRESVVHLLVGNVFTHDYAGLFEAMGRMTRLPEARQLMSHERTS